MFVPKSSLISQTTNYVFSMSANINVSGVELTTIPLKQLFL